MFLKFRKSSQESNCGGVPFSMQQATSATSNEQILQRVTSEFLQRATSATSNERILQPVTMIFCNEQLLQRVTSDFLTSNE